MLAEIKLHEEQLRQENRNEASSNHTEQIILSRRPSPLSHKSPFLKKMFDLSKVESNFLGQCTSNQNELVSAQSRIKSYLQNNSLSFGFKIISIDIS